jgi:hypothetical protein
MDESAALLSPPVNFAVVQLPGRNYPGVVIQGDTLNGVVKELAEMAKLLEARDLEELSDAIVFLSEQFKDAQSYYEEICVGRGIELPYPMG